SLAALSILGGEYQFKTTLSHTGVVHRGVLDGDLYLVGGGDPVLSAANLMDFVQALKRAQIQRVNGTLYYDDSALPSSSAIDEVFAVDAAYNGAMGALSSEFNRRVLRAEAGPTSEVSYAFLLPATPDALLSFGSASAQAKHHLAYRAQEGTQTW